MKTKSKILFISIITFISFIVGVSYAYFTTIVIGNDTASSNKAASGSLKLDYYGNDYLDISNMQPGDSSSFNFSVTNTGSLPITSYQVNFSNVINTFAVRSELVYEIECVSSDAVNCLGKSETEIPSTEGLALTQTEIASGTSHDYTLTVSFLEMGYLQDYNQEKNLFFKITIELLEVMPDTLVAVERTRYGYPFGYFWDYIPNITSITFDDVINIPALAFESWDVSTKKNGNIMAYIIDDGLGYDTFELHIQSNGDILANPDSRFYFQWFYNITQINNFDLFKTHLVTDMSYMFSSCENLTNIDLSTFDTSKVTDMSGMFYYCSSLTSLDLSSFDTSNVISMEGMFFGSASLISLDLSSFDTSKVTTMESMFSNCDDLVTLNMSTLDISSVESMQTMFGRTPSLTNLYLDDAIFVDSESYNEYCLFIGTNSSLSITVDDPTSYTWIMDKFNNRETVEYNCYTIVN